MLEEVKKIKKKKNIQKNRLHLPRLQPIILYNMAKGNLFLGTLRGSVGDITAYNSRGSQIARVRRRVIGNPRTNKQVAQRVIASTCSKFYSLANEFCKDSFQNYETPWAAQARFNKLNMRMLRNKMFADENSSPADLTENGAIYFNAKERTAPVINDFTISEGTLTFDGSRCIESHDDQLILFIPANYTSSLSYQDVCDSLQIQRGDQLTFVAVTVDDRTNSLLYGNVNAFLYARVIMDPASGDMSTPFFNQSQINSPNPRNEGTVIFDDTFTVDTNSYKYLTRINNVSVEDCNSQTVTLGAFALILSRKVGDKWFYSTEQLTLNPHLNLASSNIMTLGNAIRSWLGGDYEGTRFLQAAY